MSAVYKTAPVRAFSEIAAEAAATAQSPRQGSPVPTPILNELCQYARKVGFNGNSMTIERHLKEAVRSARSNGGIAGCGLPGVQVLAGNDGMAINYV